MHTFAKAYQYINILSIDVVAGAVVGALFFAHILQVVVPLHILVVLALTVWIIYTTDHLRDAIAIPTAASTDRHRFHQKYFRQIVVALLAIIIVDSIMIWFVTERVLTPGLMLGGAVLVYLALQRYLKFMKEFFVACLYTAGVLLPSVALLEADLLPMHFVLAGKYVVTAWMNLLLFSLFDYNQDRRHQQHSFVTWFGPAATQSTILCLALLNVLSGIWLWSFNADVAIVFIAMNVLLLTILLFRKNLISDNYYRIAGDAVFFIPLVHLI